MDKQSIISAMSNGMGVQPYNIPKIVEIIRKYNDKQDIQQLNNNNTQEHNNIFNNVNIKNTINKEIVTKKQRLINYNICIKNNIGDDYSCMSLLKDNKKTNE